MDQQGRRRPDGPGGRARARLGCGRAHRLALLALAAVVALCCGAGTASAANFTDYSNVVFSDGFESGTLGAWDGGQGGGTGTVAIDAAAAHAGSSGVRFTNAAGSYGVLVKTLPSAARDSQVSFWMRVASGSGFETIAAARDGTSALQMWGLLYDGNNHGLYFYPRTETGSTEIYSGNGSVPADTWVHVAIDYTATATGGAQLYINDQTQPSWGISGDYTRSADLQRIQLWDDAAMTTDFDDVRVATPPLAPPPPTTVPGAPTAVHGTAGDHQVALSWTAPSSDGNSAITGYRITPYVGGTAQAPVTTSSAATNYTVTGLANGTAYTFTVAAINAVGTGPDSLGSAQITPNAAAATVPGAPTNVQATAGDGSADLNWTAPSDNGGSAITAYRITPYIGTAAQTATVTSTAATSTTISGLTNGTTYTFTVAAVNGVGTGAQSAASAAVTPTSSQSPYTNVVFSDSFESGSLNAWDSTSGGSGTMAASGAAAHAGSYGARLANTAGGQYVTLLKNLGSAVEDSSVSFWVRVGPGGGMQTLAATKDPFNSQTMWGLVYDGSHHGLYFYPRTDSSSTEIYTGNESMPVNTWTKVEVRYTANSTGGAHVYINGQTQSGWGVTGDYTRANGDLQRLQLWNDATDSTDFDDVTVATTPPVPKTVPGAPTGVQGTAGDRQVALSWTAPASNGHSAITGYKITPYVGSVAQNPITTSSATTSRTITGLANGTAYTFTVAAINAIGTGADSAASPSVTPSVSAATLPDAPTAVSGVGDDTTVDLSWSTPDSDGGSAISGYRITPYVGSNAQTPITTSSAATSRTITGLTNGTSYSFTVAAINGVGTGPDSAPSASVTPAVDNSRYTNVLFSDGFESGGFSNWDSSNGTVTASGAAAHNGGFGARLTNGPGQTAVLVKKLASSVQDSSTTFWVRVGPGGGVETIAQARDANSSQTMWGLLYDGNRHGFYFYPYRSTGATEIYTGDNSAVANAWTKIEVQYTATSNGGAQLFINGQTKSSWAVTGDYTRTADLQRIQLWDDTLATTDFDDVKVATGPPPAATVPGAPTAVQGTAGKASVNLSWTKPSNDGGTSINAYRITPYIGSTAQAPITTNDAGTSQVVSGLTNGTAYTFKVAAINAVGTGPDSSASSPITPSENAVNPPSAPTNVQGTPKDRAVDLTWTGSSDDGGSAITGYRITPYIGSQAQTPTTTSSNATSATVSGLSNGTAYTFKVAGINAAGTGPDSQASSAIVPVSANQNAIQAENQQTGDPTWSDYAAPDPGNPTAIWGYANKISVNHGGSIDFFVTTTAANVNIKVYRMGWYNGAGARLMQSLGTFPGVNQPQALPDRTTGMVAENWSKTTTLNVPSSWTSGVYIARLDASNGLTSLITFIVRNDGGHEALLMQASTNTWEAYNNYGGTSLYNPYANKSVFSGDHAMKVSYDRPFQLGNGAGDFFRFEYQMVRWIERNGYDVAYTTDVDTGAGTNPLTNHKGLVVVGHDEYWDKGMRDNVESAIAQGVNVGFFSGNESYWQVRMEANAPGTPNRVVVGYKENSTITDGGGPDPMFGVNNSLLTTTWRDPLVNRPEDAMIGVMFGGQVASADGTAPYVVTNASHWVYQGTGFSNGTSVPGIVGYEYDNIHNDSTTPANITKLSASPVINVEDNNAPDTANSTIYKAPSGAWVFAAGSITWSWGLDGYGGAGYANAGIQKTTANVLDAFTGALTPPGG